MFSHFILIFIPLHIINPIWKWQLFQNELYHCKGHGEASPVWVNYITSSSPPTIHSLCITSHLDCYFIWLPVRLPLLQVHPDWRHLPPPRFVYNSLMSRSQTPLPHDPIRRGITCPRGREANSVSSFQLLPESKDLPLEQILEKGCSQTTPSGKAKKLQKNCKVTKDKHQTSSNSPSTCAYSEELDVIFAWDAITESQ